MKRRVTSLLVLIIGIFVLLAASTYDANAQSPGRPARYSLDSGIYTLGPDQSLRILIQGLGGKDNLRISFKRIGYMEQNNIFKIGEHDTTGVISLAPGEGAKFEIPRLFLGSVFPAVRGIVQSNNRNMRMNVMIIDTITNKVISNVYIDDIIIG